MITDGQTATWRGNGVGTMAQDGSVSYRGAIYFRTDSPKLAQLNSIAGIFEYQVSPDGKSIGKIWEWK